MEVSRDINETIYICTSYFVVINRLFYYESIENSTRFVLMTLELLIIVNYNFLVVGSKSSFNFNLGSEL